MTEEISGLRIAIAENDAVLRVKQETAQLRVDFKQEMGHLRHDMSHHRVELKDHMHKLHAGLTRWTFGLWVGQLVATAAVVAGMFQVFAQ